MVKKTVITKGRVAGFQYSPAVVAGGWCFVAGHAGVDASQNLVEGVEAQTRQTLDNITATLAEAGLSLADVVRTSVWLRSYRDLPVVDVVYAKYFPSDQPARTAICVADLPLGARVEIDAIALASQP